MKSQRCAAARPRKAASPGDIHRGGFGEGEGGTSVGEQLFSDPTVTGTRQRRVPSRLRGRDAVHDVRDAARGQLLHRRAGVARGQARN